jgi:hypothetical protein
MRLNRLIILYLISIGFLSCAQDTHSVDAFKDTKAYEMAVAVAKEDLFTIEKLVVEDSSILEFTNLVNGSNVLELSIDIEKHESFEKLLKLGANANYINPITKYSVLITSIQPLTNQFVWKIDHRYIDGLLKCGTDPNYAVEEDFTTEKGYHIRATSPLIEASSLDIGAVKLLIKNGANPIKKIGKKEKTGFSAAISGAKFDIINYYIDSLNVDVHQPMLLRSRDSLFIQDYIKKYMAFEEDSENFKNKEQLMKKLEKLGVDFKNYNYKLK